MFSFYPHARDKTGTVTMTCDLSNIQPRNGGIVCTSFGIILILDINNVINFINATGKVVSSMCLKDLKQVMVTVPVLSLLTICSSKLLTSWVIALALFKAQNLISSNVPFNSSLFSQQALELFLS
jgi:hypothetical protein